MAKCPLVEWYEATYDPPAATVTGVLKFTCCQPLAVSLVETARARRTPVLDHRLTVWGPVSPGLL
jgi:hypothetical protein